MKRKIFPWLRIFLLPVLFVVIHLFLTVSNLYLISYWIPETMHFLGGIVVGFTYFFILKFLEGNNQLKIRSYIKIIFIISLVALTAVFWEFYEFMLDYFFHFTFQITIADTLLDLFLGLSGGTFISVFLERIHH